MWKDGAGHPTHGKIAILLFLLNDGINVEIRELARVCDEGRVNVGWEMMHVVVVHVVDVHGGGLGTGPGTLGLVCRNAEVQLVHTEGENARKEREKVREITDRKHTLVHTKPFK